MKLIAKRAVIAVDKKTKERSEIIIEVFEPYPVDDGKNYFCHIHFNGLDGESQEVGGVDSLQALTLAIHQLKTRFETLQNEYEFFWPEANDPMDSIDYLPKELS